METLCEILDQAKTKNEIRSDAQLALRLGIDKTMLTRYRKRHAWPSDPIALELAQLAGIRPARVLAILHAERSESEAVRSTWFDMAAHLVLVLAFSAVLALLPGSAHAAGSHHRHQVTPDTGASIHYATLGLASLTAAIIAYTLYLLGFPIAHP